MKDECRNEFKDEKFDDYEMESDDLPAILVNYLRYSLENHSRGMTL